MAREKATITVDREKLERARALTGSRSVSGAIDLALDELLRAERLRHDIAAYAAQPPTADDRELALQLPVAAGLADETDWEAIYRDP